MSLAPPLTLWLLPQICVSFDAQELTVALPGEQQLKFPNRLGLEAIEFFSVEGDFRVKSIKFK